MKKLLIGLLVATSLIACTPQPNTLPWERKPFVCIACTPQQNTNPSLLDGVVVVGNNTGLGTGFFIDKNIIMTNAHVVSATGEFTVRMKSSPVDGYKIKVLMKDDYADIAFIEIVDYDKFISENKTPHIFNFAPYNSTYQDQPVAAIGHPHGFMWTFSRGRIVNLLKIEERTHLFVITDASIFQGNSGGPLIDENGNIIGINSELFSFTGGSFGASIPSDLIKKFYSDYLKYKQIRWPLIGIQMDKFGTITEIAVGGPADKAGLKKDDKLLSASNSLGSYEFNNNVDNVIYNFSTTDYHDVEHINIQRGKQKLTFDVVPDYAVSVSLTKDSAKNDKSTH